MQLSNDLTSTSNQAFQWKMIFNPDLKIRAQKVTFGRKSKKLIRLFYSIILRWTKTLPTFTCSKLTIDSSLWIHFTRFSRVSIIDFEWVNVSWEYVSEKSWFNIRNKAKPSAIYKKYHPKNKENHSSIA